MAATLHIIGLVFFLSLQVQAEVPVQKDFDANQFSGKWYGVGGVSNCSNFLKMKDGMTQPVLIFSVEADGSLKCSAGFKMPDGCKKREVIYKIISSGHYSYSGPNGEKTDVFIVGTDYKSFTLEYTSTMKENVYTVMLKLYGRHNDVSPDIKQQFEQYALKLGFTKEQMALFPAAEECVPGTF